MILTYKIKHGRDLMVELLKAKKVAKYALKTGSRTSADVKHIGLKSIISNQILKKYSRNKRLKKVSKVVLTVPNQGIKVDREKRSIWISSLKLELSYVFDNGYDKINQIELDDEYAYVSVSVLEPELSDVDDYLGVDLNTTGHCAVVGIPSTGKTIKMGKSAEHVHNKYKNIRRDLQKKGKYKKVKSIKNRENRIVRDMNHKMSRKIVDVARENNCGIKLEDLRGIRNNPTDKSFKYSLNSWSFYQLRQMIEYKAKLLGIPVVLIDPAYTSQECSLCGTLGSRSDKSFKCRSCGHVDNADVNASFNIALRSEGVYRSFADRDV